MTKPIRLAQQLVKFPANDQKTCTPTLRQIASLAAFVEVESGDRLIAELTTLYIESFLAWRTEGTPFVPFDFYGFCKVVLFWTERLHTDLYAPVFERILREILQETTGVQLVPEVPPNH